MFVLYSRVTQGFISVICMLDHSKGLWLQSKGFQDHRFCLFFLSSLIQVVLGTLFFTAKSYDPVSLRFLRRGSPALLYLILLWKVELPSGECGGFQEMAKTPWYLKVRGWNQGQFTCERKSFSKYLCLYLWFRSMFYDWKLVAHCRVSNSKFVCTAPWFRRTWNIGSAEFKDMQEKKCFREAWVGLSCTQLHSVPLFSCITSVCSPCLAVCKYLSLDWFWRELMKQCRFAWSCHFKHVAGIDSAWFCRRFVIKFAALLYQVFRLLLTFVTPCRSCPSQTAVKPNWVMIGLMPKYLGRVLHDRMGYFSEHAVTSSQQMSTALQLALNVCYGERAWLACFGHFPTRI